MDDIFSKKHIRLIAAISIIFGIFFVGLIIGKQTQSREDQALNIINKDSGKLTQVDFSTFWKAWNILDDKFVPTGSTTEKVSDQKRVYGAIQGMVFSLGDPYTVFLPPVENKNFNEEISGNFEGVGMEVGIKDMVLTVISPLKDTPAYNAGIKSGDKILKINDTITTKLSVEEAVGLIRGKKGTTVKFTLTRADLKDPFEISVLRDVINLPTVDVSTKNDVFIIRLYSFSAISPNLFRGALRQFIESGKSKLVIDLRGNPGGYLEAAIDMASWFLPSGKVVVQEQFSKSQDKQFYRSKGYDVFNSQLKLVILIDGGSASASEILAGALHEHSKATLVGTQSFGKGSVQELVDISSETSLKVTIAKWLTPNGISISNGGLKPDIVIPLDEKEFAKGNDTQLNKALEILNK